MGQLWATSTQGGYAYSPLLSKEMVTAAQPEMKFKQFTVLREQWGKNAGETFLFDKYGDIDTQGTTLTETSTIPAHGHRLYQSTATLQERGNSIPFTRKYTDLAQVTVRSGIVTALKNDLAKHLDIEVEAQFDACKIHYSGTATDGGVFATGGTATNTLGASLNLYHVRQIVDYMYQTMKAATYDGDNYMCICSTDAKRGIFDEVDDILKYTKYPASGEFGRYYDVRFVKTNHALDNTRGTGNAFGEAYFFGGNEGPVLEGVAVAPVVIKKEVTDYGRSRGLAWYSIQAFKIFWEGDPDNNIVKYASNA